MDPYYRPDKSTACFLSSLPYCPICPSKMYLQMSRDIVVIPITHDFGSCYAHFRPIMPKVCNGSTKMCLGRIIHPFQRKRSIWQRADGAKKNQAVILPATKTHSLFNLFCKNQWCLVPGFEDLKMTSGLHFGYFLNLLEPFGCVFFSWILWCR